MYLQKDLYKNFHFAIHNSQKPEIIYMSIKGKGIEKLWYTATYYSAIQTEETHNSMDESQNC